LPVNGHRRTSAAWTLALVTVGIGAAVAADQHGRASRLRFTPPDSFQGHRWGLIQDAAAATEFWSASGLRGRQLLVASGRWGKPVPQEVVAAMARAEAAGQITPALERASQVSGALFEATMRGVARELLVVMPPAAFGTRVAAIRAARETTVGAGWASQTYHGIPRTFFLPSQLARPGEEVLLLVEPSFFADGAPTDLVGWLEEKGVRFDLALIAAQDPEATPSQQEAAQALAASLGAVTLEVAPP
jgi:hypothetical protein